jgi:hypothetical protein
MGNDVAVRLQWLAIAILAAAFIGTAARVIAFSGCC